jgi:hypothetical protein
MASVGTLDTGKALDDRHLHAYGATAVTSSPDELPPVELGLDTSGERNRGPGFRGFSTLDAIAP